MWKGIHTLNVDKYSEIALFRGCINLHTLKMYQCLLFYILVKNELSKIHLKELWLLAEKCSFSLHLLIVEGPRHLFKDPSTICISFVSYLFMPFAIFSSRVLIVFLLTCRSSLYFNTLILLSNMFVTNIFPRL